jgi:hypothetical protein
MTPLMIFYAICAVLGAVIPWYFNLQAISEGKTIADFFREAGPTNITSSLSMDLVIGATAFTVWMVAEARRLGMRHWWVYLVATFMVAFAFAAPLFLLMRERKLARTQQPLAAPLA